MLYTRIEILSDIINYVKQGKIKSFHVDNIIYDISNIKLIDITQIYNSNIYISNKYIPLLCEIYNIEDVCQHVCQYERDIQIITIENKFLNLNMTYHSVQQLVKRFVYMYVINQNKFEFGKLMNELYVKYFNYCFNLIIEKQIEDVKKDAIVLKLMSDLLKISKPFSKSNTGRHKDVWNFELREKIHDKATMHFIHPFLFIVEEGFIKTVELYSSSLSMDRANKFTNNNKKFKDFLLKNSGI